MFHLSDYAVALLGKIMCYAICALAMDLIWGYTGILSLGHGLFFALGGYAMGIPDAPDRPRRQLPERPAGLHGVSGLEGLPWHWALSDSFVATLMFVAVPGAWWPSVWLFAFRSRIKGVYFRSSRRP